jgi:hypothetical protein
VTVKRNERFSRETDLPALPALALKFARMDAQRDAPAERMHQSVHGNARRASRIVGSPWPAIYLCDFSFSALQAIDALTRRGFGLTGRAV